MDLQQTFTVSVNVITQEVSGETVLLNLESEEYFGLDSVGTRAWQLINEGQSLGEVLASMLDEYDVEESRLLNDLRALLSEVVERGLATPKTKT
ncbi:MAG: PqqD family protein [Pseudomonadota bacterium]